MVVIALVGLVGPAVAQQPEAPEAEVPQADGPAAGAAEPEAGESEVGENPPTEEEERADQSEDTVDATSEDAAAEESDDDPQATADAATNPSGVTMLQPIAVDSGGSFVDEMLPIWTGGERWTRWRLFLLLLFTAFMTLIVRRARESLPDAGVVPRSLRVAHIVLRLWVFVVGVALLAAFLEPSFGSTFPWVLLAVAVAIGWSVRDVIPDVSAFFVLVFERRVRRGVWIAGDGFSGEIERRGLRAVWIRDRIGHRIAVPNRVIVTQPISWQLDESPMHDVAVRIRNDATSARTRQAIHDAVLSSPWVRADATPEVHRDGREPDLWHVRARLLDLRYAAHFEGDILERAEDVLAAADAATTD